MIDDKNIFQQMQGMYPGMGIHSDYFGCDDNWMIRLLPKGVKQRSKSPGKPCISICCIKVPYGIIAMKLQYTVGLKCESWDTDVNGSYIAWETNVFPSKDNGSIGTTDRKSTEFRKVSGEKWIKIKVSV